MPRDAGYGLDGEHTFRRHPTPLGDGASRDAQSARNPELQPVLGTDQLHTRADRGGRAHDSSDANLG